MNKPLVTAIVALVPIIVPIVVKIAEELLMTILSNDRDDRVDNDRSSRFVNYDED